MSNVNEILTSCVSIEGAVAGALVDRSSGMTLGSAGDRSAINLEVAAAGNTDVVRSMVRTIEGSGLTETIEDILITLGQTYHLIRLVQGHQDLFLYLVLNKQRANLAMARYRLVELEKQLVL